MRNLLDLENYILSMIDVPEKKIELAKALVEYNRINLLMSQTVVDQFPELVRSDMDVPEMRDYISVFLCGVILSKSSTRYILEEDYPEVRRIGDKFLLTEKAKYWCERLSKYVTDSCLSFEFAEVINEFDKLFPVVPTYNPTGMECAQYAKFIMDKEIHLEVDLMGFKACKSNVRSNDAKQRALSIRILNQYVTLLPQLTVDELSFNISNKGCKWAEANITYKEFLSKAKNSTKVIDPRKYWEVLRLSEDSYIITESAKEIFKKAIDSMKSEQLVAINKIFPVFTKEALASIRYGRSKCNEVEYGVKYMQWILEHSESW